MGDVESRGVCGGRRRVGKNGVRAYDVWSFEGSRRMVLLAW
jgi:hypothetical protein